MASIDLELAWGVWDRPRPEDLDRARELERPIVQRLLTLFDRYEIAATWAVVGAMFDDDPPAPPMGPTDAWSAPELVDAIADARVDHEIGTHSYAHVYFDAISAAEAAEDLERAASAHRKRDLAAPRSMVFPRNKVGHLDVLRRSGIEVFRSVDAGLLALCSARAPRLRPVVNLADKMTPVPAPTVLPIAHAEGFVEVPSSLLLIGRNGLRRAVRPRVMDAKMAATLELAARRNRIFHLWFHPSNFYFDTETQFGIFERALRRVARMRDAGRLDVGTMGELASLSHAA